MKIMQIAPFSFAIGENIRYGGIERVVNDLDKGLTLMNEESYVVATRDSIIKGILCPTFSEGLWKPQDNKKDGWKYERGKFDYDKKLEEHSEMALNHIRAINPDIIHDHAGLVRTDVFRKVINKKEFPPILYTPHDRFNPETITELIGIKELCPEKIFFNAISFSQKKEYEKFIPVDFMIYNGVDTDFYPYSSNSEGFAFALGLINFLKGSDLSLKIARESNKKLIMAGPILTGNPQQKKALGAIGNFWEKKVRPYIDLVVEEEIRPENVEGFVDYFMNSSYQSAYVGELSNLQKVEFYKRAELFLHPARVHEAFGLVLIESMACGTPVVAYSRGAIPEIISNGKTGYVVDPKEIEEGTVYNSISSVKNIKNIPRIACRKHVEENFSIKKQVENYLEIYKQIVPR